MADEPRCSECCRPFVDEPCGFVHAVAQVELALMRRMSLDLFGGHSG